MFLGIAMSLITPPEKELLAGIAKHGNDEVPFGFKTFTPPPRPEVCTLTAVFFSAAHVTCQLLGMTHTND